MYTTAVWVYVDGTQIKARDRTYYLWLAVDERGLPVSVRLSRRRDSWTAKLVLYNTKAKGCINNKGPYLAKINSYDKRGINFKFVWFNPKRTFAGVDL
ncbi:MAG: DDE-type integrase/transposase/recombinase [Thermocrinis sp.]|uniref:DDE-type integrase/transposase/recombinase n=1 Tax=Thermocrinis sp. TaxID=2024383 RepID=UPI003C0B25A7